MKHADEPDPNRRLQRQRHLRADQVIRNGIDRTQPAGTDTQESDFLVEDDALEALACRAPDARPVVD